MPLPKTSHAIMKTILPSTGREVRFRPMQGREEKLLLIAKESGDQEEILTTVCQVVGNCLLDGGDALDMPIFDVEWLFVQIRIASVAPTAPVAYIDGSDKKRYDFEVDLREVTIKGDPLKLTTIKVSDDVAFEMDWPVAGAFVDPDVSAAETDAETAHRLAASCVAKVFDGDNVVDCADVPFEEVDEFLSSLPLDKYQEALDHVARVPVLYYRIGYTNTKEEEREVVLNNLTDFFRFR